MCYIAYYRVSTTDQGNSGLGIEAQQKAVKAFCKEGQLQAEFTDIESGKNDNRPELLKALQLAKETKCTLLIAKLDRLSRNLTFISTLMDAGVKFKCCDMPEADNFTIHIFAALAQKEREMISSRTKAALQSLKARGIKLGKPENFTTEGQRAAHAATRAKAANNINNQQSTGYAQALRSNGKTLKEIAEALNKSGHKTSKGGAFTPTQVSRLL